MVHDLKATSDPIEPQVGSLFTWDLRGPYPFFSGNSVEPTLQDWMLSVEHHLDMRTYSCAENRSLLQGFGHQPHANLEQLLGVDLERGFLSLLQK